MKTVVKKILFMFVLVVGLSLTSMAQKGDDKKKTPPKGNAPVINPGKGNNPPPRGNPKGGDKPKKPGGGEAFLLISLKREDLA